MVAHVFTFTEVCLCIFCNSSQVSFPCNLQDSLENFLQNMPDVSELLQLLFIWESLILCLTFDGWFAGYSILGWQFYSFKNLNLLAHCLLASKVSDKKSNNLIEDSSYVTSCFSLATFKILSLYLAFGSLVIICLVWVSQSSSFLEFVGILGYLYLYHQSGFVSFQRVFRYSLYPLSVSFWDSHKSLRLYSLFFILFSLYASKSVISIEQTLSSGLLIHFLITHICT